MATTMFHRFSTFNHFPLAISSISSSSQQPTWVKARDVPADPTRDTARGSGGAYKSVRGGQHDSYDIAKRSGVFWGDRAPGSGDSVGESVLRVP